VCSPGRKGHDDLTSSPPSSSLSLAVSLEFPAGPLATLVLSCHHSVGHSKETAGDKPEEGGDDVKSSWPLHAGLHTCYNGGDSGQQPGDR